MAFRVKGCEQEVQQEADGLLHVDLMSARHPLVELVEHSGEHGFQAGHVELYVWVQVIQSVFPQRFDDVPNVHQVQVAFLLYESQLACCSVGGEADAIQILSP